MIHTLNTGVAEITAVVLPEGAHDIAIHRIPGRCHLWYKIPNNNLDKFELLPPGRYTYLCTLNTATEEQAREIVGDGDKINPPLNISEHSAWTIWKNHDRLSSCAFVYTALESLRSLFAELNYHDIAILLKEK